MGTPSPYAGGGSHPIRNATCAVPSGPTNTSWDARRPDAVIASILTLEPWAVATSARTLTWPCAPAGTVSMAWFTPPTRTWKVSFAADRFSIVAITVPAAGSVAYVLVIGGVVGAAAVGVLAYLVVSRRRRPPTT